MQHLPEKQYLIRLVQSRFEWLGLSREQAEKIHDYERNVETPYISGSNSPSVWEEKEIEGYYFKEVLDARQFLLYRKAVSDQIAAHEQALADEDARAVREVNYATKILQYYTDEVIPPLIERRKDLYASSSIHRKLDYLKEEYDLFLKSCWKEACVMHFRHSRNLQPNKFKSEQLRHELEKVYPTWSFFERGADEATRAVAQSLVKDLGFYVEQSSEFLQTSYIQHRAEEIYLELFPKNLRNKPVIVLGQDRSERKQQEDGFLSYLLIDPDRYR